MKNIEKIITTFCLTFLYFSKSEFKEKSQKYEMFNLNVKSELCFIYLFIYLFKHVYVIYMYDLFNIFFFPMHCKKKKKKVEPA